MLGCWGVASAAAGYWFSLWGHRAIGDSSSWFFLVAPGP